MKSATQEPYGLEIDDLSFEDFSFAGRQVLTLLKLL